MDYPNLTSFSASKWKDKSLKPYLGRMSVDNEQVIKDSMVEKLLATIGEVAPYAPRSVYRVAKLYESLARYAPEFSPRPRATDDIRAGIAFARACFSRKPYCGVLEPLPLTLDTVKMVTSSPKASAGLTAYGKRKRDVFDVAFKRAQTTLRKERSVEPCLAGARTQINDKTRLVWMYPFSMTILEALLAYPLNRRFKDGGTPMSFAMKTSAVGMRIGVNQQNYRFAYALDASKFDSSICAWFIHEAFHILRGWFDVNQVVPGTNVTVGTVFDLVENYFVFTPIVMPDSRIYRGKRHGVPSGSYFTQIVDSIVNCIMCGTISHHFGLGVRTTSIMVLGDDSLFFSDKYVALDAISKYAEDVLSIHLHGEEKSHIYGRNDRIHYLGRDWLNGRPDIAKPEALARMVYPERYREYPSDPEARDRAIRLLVLAFAATYSCMWTIAWRLYGSGTNLEDPELVDMWAYGLGDSDFDPNWMSGYRRFKMLYEPHENLWFVTTGILFML